MNNEDITTVFERVWKPEYGSVFAGELMFIRDLIRTHKPENVLEVGIATGLSTGFIANFLEEQGGGSLLSLDSDDRFFGDRSKETGFLVPEIHQGNLARVNLVTGKTALDIAEFDQKFDLVFIDANHQHPWPGLDMMAIYPYMTGPRIMIHHDLRLFMTQDVMFGIGPKYLYDQVPESHRQKCEARDGNTFFVDLNLPQARFEALLVDLIKLPWSLRTPIQSWYVDQIREIMRTHYSPGLLNHFDRCLKLYNHADRFRTGV